MLLSDESDLLSRLAHLTRLLEKLSERVSLLIPLLVSSPAIFNSTSNPTLPLLDDVGASLKITLPHLLRIVFAIPGEQ